MDRPLTIRQLAALAGVSRSTLSRALRNDAKTSSETRQRLQKLAADSGYIPNPMVSALMASRVRLRASSEQQIIAYISAFRDKDAWKSYPTFLDYFNGAQERAAQYGYRLEEFWLREPRMNSTKISEILFYRNIHGLLVAPLPRAIAHMSLKWERFSAAALGYSLARPFLHRAVHDNVSAIRTALRNLQRRGYRRIGLVENRANDERSNSAWSGGFAEYTVLRPQRDRVRPFLYPHWSNYDPAFQRWLDKNRPDCVVSSSIFVLGWLKEAGLDVPKDIGFVLLDRPLQGSECSGIYFNGPAIGAAAIDLIVGQINRNERGLPELAKTTMVKGHWVEGKTLRAASA